MLGSLALVSFVLLLVLFWRGPHFTADGDDFRVNVTCGSVAAVGWPSDHSTIDTTTSASYGDHTDLPDMPSTEADAARAGISRDCSERRDTYLGLMVLLGVFTTLFGAGAVAWPRSGRDAHA